MNTTPISPRKLGRKKTSIMSILMGRVIAGFVLVLRISTIAHAQAKPAASGAAAAPAPATAASATTSAFESQMLAYGALDKISQALARRVCSLEGVDKENGTIIIYDQASFASLAAYQAFLTNAKIVSGGYATLIPVDQRAGVQLQVGKDLQNRAHDYSDMASKESRPDRRAILQHFSELFAQKAQSALAAPAAAITLSTDPGVDATALLSAIAVSSNVETPGQITIPDSNLAVALARDIEATCNSKHLSIIYPPLFGKGSSSEIAAADIQTEIQTVDTIRSEAQQAVEDANKDFIKSYSFTQTKSNQTTSSDQTTHSDPKKKGNEEQKQLGSQDTQSTVTGSGAITGDAVLTAAFTDVNGLYDSFMNSLLTINAATGASGSTTVIQGEMLAKVLAGSQQEIAAGDDPYATWARRPAFILLASVANAGGTELDHKTFWTALSTGDKITYSGGAIVNVAVWQANSAAPVYANVLRYRVPFSDVADPGDSSPAKVGKVLP
jgi:hypothetical protein